MVEEYSYQVNQLCYRGTDRWPSLYVSFQSNIMQMKLIQEIKFVGKATYEIVREIQFVQRRFINLRQADKTSEKRVSLDVVVQTHRI